MSCIFEISRAHACLRYLSKSVRKLFSLINIVLHIKWGTYIYVFLFFWGGCVSGDERNHGQICDRFQRLRVQLRTDGFGQDVDDAGRGGTPPLRSSIAVYITTTSLYYHHFRCDELVSDSRRFLAYTCRKILEMLPKLRKLLAINGRRTTPPNSG